MTDRDATGDGKPTAHPVSGQPFCAICSDYHGDGDTIGGIALVFHRLHDLEARLAQLEGPQSNPLERHICVTTDPVRPPIAPKVATGQREMAPGSAKDGTP